MADLNNFNPADVPEDDRSFEPLPAGDYRMQVIDSEIKPTKSGGGDQLVLTLEVIEGPMSNRRVWDRLNIRNQNADAQRIAQRALADLCIAVGITGGTVRDSEELHFKPFTARLKIREDKTGQYGPQNAVRYLTGRTSAPAGGAQQRQAAPGATGQPRPAAGGAKPWNNRAA